LKQRNKLTTRSKSDQSSSEKVGNRDLEKNEDNFKEMKRKDPRSLKRKKKKCSTNPWMTLPEDLQLYIFSNLNTRSLLKISRVCCAWYGLLMDKDIRIYLFPKRALLERKLLYKLLTSKGIDIPIPKECMIKHQPNFAHISTEKKTFLQCCLNSPHWHYEKGYILTPEQLNNSGSFKKTLLPATTYAKSKLVLLFPEGIIHYMLYAVTVQGVEISSGKLTMDSIQEHLRDDKDLNLDPLILRTLPLMGLIYQVTSQNSDDIQ